MVDSWRSSGSKRHLGCLEADRPLQQLQLPAYWQLLKETRAGQVYAGLYQTTR